MKREDKYPDTNTFHFHNQNPKGRITGDCTFRAISTAMRQDYNQTVMEMAELMCETGYTLNDKKGIEAYLKAKGWTKCKQPVKDDRTKYTGAEFCGRIRYRAGDLNGEYYNKNIIAMIGAHHIVAIVHGRIWDTWNSTGGKIGNYWVKEA